MPSREYRKAAQRIMKKIERMSDDELLNHIRSQQDHSINGIFELPAELFAASDGLPVYAIVTADIAVDDLDENIEIRDVVWKLPESLLPEPAGQAQLCSCG